tara:strand:+ start:843 stop:1565 length:723 start_codon:yes stop_codon:yes gene_type:complete
MKGILFLREGTDTSLEVQEALCGQQAALLGVVQGERHVHTGKALSGRHSGSWTMSQRAEPELFAAVRSVGPGDVFVAVAPRFVSPEPVAASVVHFAVDDVGGSVHWAQPGDPSVLTLSGVVMQLSHFRRSLDVLSKGRARAASRSLVAGAWPGGTVPFGYELAPGKDGASFLRRVTAQQVVIDRMEELRNEGNSYRGIAAVLAEEGVYPPRGGAVWQPNSIRRALSRREHYDEVALPAKE